MNEDASKSVELRYRVFTRIAVYFSFSANYRIRIKEHKE